MAPKPLFAPDVEWLFEAADDDVEDRYVFTVKSTSPALELAFDSPAGGGVLRFTDDALERADRLFEISQGGAWDDGGKALPDPITHACPPILLPRSVYAKLAADGTATLHVGGDERELECLGKARATVHVSGKATEIDVLRIQGNGVEMWVVADASWPLVLDRRDGGEDQGWRFLAAGSGLTVDDEPPKPSFGKIAPLSSARKKKKGPGSSEAELVEAATGKGKASQRIAAIEKLASIESDASTTALLLAAIDPDYKIAGQASKVLRQREQSPGFARCILAALEELAASRPERIRALMNRVTKGHVEACPELLERIRAVYREDPSTHGSLRAVLVGLGDEVTARELVQSLDAHLDAPDARHDALRALRLVSGVRALGEKLRSQFDTRAGDASFWSGASWAFDRSVEDVTVLVEVVAAAPPPVWSAIERSLPSGNVWSELVASASDELFARVLDLAEKTSHRPLVNDLVSAFEKIADDRRRDMLLERLVGKERIFDCIRDLLFRSPEAFAPRLVALAERTSELPADDLAAIVFDNQDAFRDLARVLAERFAPTLDAELSSDLARVAAGETV